MRKINQTVAGIVFTATIVVAIAAPTQALEYGTPSPQSKESSAVASLKIGKTGSFGDCTGTLIEKQWVVTARHCLEAKKNQGSQVRFGQGNNTEIYDVNSWAVAPNGDVGLMHLDHKVNNITPAELSSILPSVGELGQIYGWSNNSSMARNAILPMSEWVVKGELGSAQLSPDESNPKDPKLDQIAFQKNTELTSGPVLGGPHFDEISSNSVIGQPPNIYSYLSDKKDGDVIPMSGGLLELHSISQAGIQGGDSGGPFFVKGRVAGVITASTGTVDENIPSRGLVLTPIVGAREWIDKIISGKDRNSIITPDTAPALESLPQVSQSYAIKALIISILIILTIGVGTRLRRQAY